MKRKHLLFTLLLALVVPLAATAQSNLPFSENFNLVTEGSIPDGWSAGPTSTGQGTVGVVRQNSNGFLAFIVTGLNNSGKGAVSVQMPTNTAGNWYRTMSFNLRPSASTAGTFYIGYYAEDNSSFPPTTVWHEIATYQATELTAGSWQTFTVPVAFPNNQTIVFRTLTQATSNWAIDDLSITDGLKPTNLSVVASQTSATLTWDANYANQWRVQYMASGATSWTSVTATTNTYTLTNLDPGIEYQVRVRALETTLNVTSGASDVLTFTTDALIAVPYPGSNHEIFGGSHPTPPAIYLPDNWDGLISPSGEGTIQTHNELLNPNLPEGPREGWLRLTCTGTPNYNNPIRLTAVLPNFDCAVNLLKVKILIKPSSTTNSSCGYLSLGYFVGNDLTSFATIESYNPSDYSASEYTTVEKAITGIPANARLALRYSATSSGQSGSYWDVDYNMVAGDLVSEIVPTNFQLTAHDATSASFTWDAITGATYELEYRTLDKATYNWSDWTSEAVNTGSCTITIADGLRYRYYAQVKAVGYDDQGTPYYSSVSSDVIDFFPVEELVTEFPYQQTFEVDQNHLDGKLYTFEENVLYTLSPQWYYHNASVSPTDPNRTIESGWGEYRYVYRYLPNNGNRLDFCVVNASSTSFGTPSPQYAVSPKIQNLSEKTMKFSGIGYAHTEPHVLNDFFIQNNPGAKITIEIGVMTDPMDPTTFELIQTVTFIGTHDLDDDIVYFDTFTGGDAHIAFRVTPSTDSRNKYFKLNMVCVEEAPCAKPIRNLAVVDGSETETSVGLSWDSNNEIWEVQFRPVTSSGYNEIWQNRYITTNPYTLTGLTANTHYQVRVRANCTNELGDWSDVIDALTACSSTFQALPYYENFVYVPDMEVPQCWTVPEVESLNAPYVWTDNAGNRVLELSTSPSGGQQSRVYLPKMTNLNHLKVKIRACKGSTSQPVFLVRLCRNIDQANQNNNTVAIFDAYSLLTSEFQTFEFYTETDMDEGWIELYTNTDGMNPTSVVVDWIEVTTAVTYNKHFTGTYNGIDWAAAGNWDPWGTPTATDNVYLNDGFNVVIPAGFDAVVNAVDFDSEHTTLTIEDGGSLRFNQGQWNRIGAQNYKLVNVTVKKNVRHYTLANNRYKLLAVPISDFNDHIINSGDFFTNDLNDPNYNNTDLYSFDPSCELEWRNWKAQGCLLHRGEGALYANAVDTELSFDIRVDVPEDFEKTVQQPAQQGAPFYRWALLGNPYTCNAYIRDRDVQSYYFPYYILNDNGDALVLAPSGRGIKPLEGVFVQGWETGVTNYAFTPDAPQNRGGNIDLTVRNASTRSADVLDRARVEFGEGTDFEHCDILPSPNRLYIPSDSKQLSVAHAGTLGEMPVNFEPAADGTYTIAMETEETELSYLHLVDHLTGDDIDLLQTPSYTFNAKYSDYPSRFKLVFAKGSTEQGDNFAFMRDGHLMLFGIEGTATLQVIDILGHVLSSDTFSGSYDKQLNVAPGVYVLRMINENQVKTQKIVIK